MSKTYFPDILAVDPSDCGCTECIVGEYVPETQWAENALPGDVIAVLNGTVKINSYPEDPYQFVTYAHFSNPETKEFVRKIDEHAQQVLTEYFQTYTGYEYL